MKTKADSGLGQVTSMQAHHSSCEYEYRKFNCPLPAVSRGIGRRVWGNGRLMKDRSAVGGGCFARICASPFP